MVNATLLFKEIERNGVTMDTIADALQLNRAQLDCKMSNVGRGFTVGEMQKLVLLLKISYEDANIIFFK